MGKKEEVPEEDLALEARINLVAKAMLLLKELKENQNEEEFEVVKKEEVEEVKKEEVEEVKKEEVPEEDLVLEARIDNIANALLLLKKSRDAEVTEEKKEEVAEEKKEEVAEEKKEEVEEVKKEEVVEERVENIAQ